MCIENFQNIIICDEKLQESYLLLTYCMTYSSSYSDEHESEAVSFGSCPYVYYGHIVNKKYIALTQNISDLNNIFCAPLNRDGLLCRDCIDGFGPSVITIGYACASCTENNYGWMLYILSELFPAIFCSSHTSSPKHICTNELLCYVQPVTGKSCKQCFSISVRIRCNLTCCVQGHSHRIWILEPGLLPLYRSTILCEPTPQKYPHASLPSSMCLPYIHYCRLHLHMLVLNYMGTTSDQLSGYGDHFIDVVSMLDGGGTQKHPLLMSLLHFFFCPTLNFCLCHYFSYKG